MKKSEQNNITFKKFGESALLIEWPPQIDEMILNEVTQLQNMIESKKIPGLIETVNTYNSLTLIFDTNQISDEALIREIDKIRKTTNMTQHTKRRQWSIPVCYDPKFGIDLEEMAREKKISTTEIISLHCNADYIVYFTGFLPGFLYLGGLSEKIHTPRKSTPRLQVAKGAVAIGGAQTGIYPSESPGGWNIIGNSPLEFFDPLKNPPCFAKAGDRIRFYSIDPKEYDQIKAAVTTHKFEPEVRLI